MGNNWGTFLKQRGIQTNVAPELIRRGWELFDYQEPTHEEESFMSFDCRWTGVAVHPDAPDTILCVWVGEHDVRDYSGKPVYDLSRLPELPDNAVLPFNLPQFPVFQANPKGFGWHIEKNGEILHKGKFPKECDRIHEWLYRAPIEQTVDKIEQLALGRMIIKATPAPKKLPAPSVTEQCAVTAAQPPRHTTLACRPIAPGYHARTRKPLGMRGARVYEAVPRVEPKTRHVVSLSSGVPSAVAAQRAIDKYGRENVDLVFADTKAEHRDNYRFLWELCQRWGTIQILMDGRTPSQVADDKQLIPNQMHAPCTYELKIKPLQNYVKSLQKQGFKVVMVIGMDTKDKHKGRTQAPITNWKRLGVNVRYPLLMKPKEIDVMSVVKSWGLKPPVTYGMGFKHANCLDDQQGGCWKMGHSDWRRVMTYFPDAFANRRDWESNKRQDPRFADHTIMKRERVENGVRITEPYSLAEMELEQIAADTRQRRLFELNDDLQGCGVECGVNADWEGIEQPRPAAGHEAGERREGHESTEVSEHAMDR